MTPKRKTTQSGRKAVRSATDRGKRPTQRGRVAERGEDRRSTTRRREKAAEGEDEATRQQVDKHMLDAAFSLAKSTGAAKILLYLESLGGKLELISKRKTECGVVLVTRDGDAADTPKVGPVSRIVKVPPVKLSRTGQIKVALVNALVTGAIKRDERVVAVSGPGSQTSLDTLMVIDPSHEVEMFALEAKAILSREIPAHVFEECLKLAIELAHQGREGKPVGAIFVIGDHENVLQLSRQMIINPFKGYSDRKCSIFNDEIRDTIREFAALDGAFVIRKDGVVLAAGRLLSSAAADGTVPRGLGSRHAAGAGITATTKALCITISESDGTVRIFKGGKVLTSITKPAI